ncbi:O-antigen polymerase [Wenyingzhuangia sp. 2_MG-2023]|uniref:O-antigen polymerase n=1 Tax=Wenyingzhuangia sp. 2_MG-2023 TaxID=3062639 RepID=UPI0026E2B95A|nr:O-antigen polymerase [Wenyingzhuangia sp. 2_MG-2023]MDO6739311.1 O-antigen polymerase [Wenyingzhuangia sp. 2_MG-2023]
MKFVKTPENRLSLLKIGAWFLVLYNNIAWVVVLIIHHFVLKNSLSHTFKNGSIKTDLYNYVLAIIYITIFSCVLSLLGGIKKIKEGEALLYHKIKKIEILDDKKIRVVLIFLFAIQMLLISLGIIGQRTLNIESFQEGKIPFWLPFFNTSLFVYKVFLVLFAIRIKSFYSKRMIETLLYLAPIFFISFSAGRRPIVYLFVFLIYWWYLFGKTIKLKVAMIALLLMPVVSGVFVFSQFVRNYKIHFNSSAEGIDMFMEAYELFSNSPKIMEKYEDESIENIAFRPLIAWPLSACFAYENKSFTYGENIFNSLIWVIPGPLIPNKKDYPVQEGLLYQHFKIGTLDTADSLYLSAYTEFSYFGVLIYPLLIYFLWAILLKFNLKLNFNTYFLIISIGVFFELVVLKLGESALTGWFSGFRTLVFLGICFVVFDKKQYQVKI